MFLRVRRASETPLKVQVLQGLLDPTTASGNPDRASLVWRERFKRVQTSSEGLKRLSSQNVLQKLEERSEALDVGRFQDDRGTSKPF